MRIEPAGASDRAAWCRVQHACSPLLPLAPIDLEHDERTLRLVQRWIVRDDGATVIACGALRTHALFAQPDRLALDLYVVPAARAAGVGGRAPAPATGRGGRARGARRASLRAVG